MPIKKPPRARLQLLRKPINRFSALQILGFFIGGIIPLAAILIWDTQSPVPFIEPQAFHTVFILSIATFILGSLVGHFGDDHADGIAITFLFYIQAVLSIIVIHFVVLYSGGPIVSVLALSYLYLPAVVGYTYGAGVHLYGAAGCLLLSYTLNLLFASDQKAVFQEYLLSGSKFSQPDKTGTLYTYLDGIGTGWEPVSALYGFVFVLQLIVTTKIAALPAMPHNQDADERLRADENDE